ncbi:MAG: M1 family metallopeptidase, partial [Draconibacterium sp.]|nr:M1 family metallopeptidase [Draconibacterium sp.]
IRQMFFICLFGFGSVSTAFSQTYFQQEVNYNINVSLNDKLHELNAFETVQYINNSSDTLRFIYFHLWPNAYSNNNTPLAKQLLRLNGKQRLFSDSELKGSIDSLNFEVNGNQVRWNLLPEQPDICQVFLDTPLKSGDSITISTPFRVKIPKGVTSRLGHIGESYQISQWYPKPAVYDQNGWHPMSYLDQGEFYSEFGSFEVNITLPANYIVGATGNLQNQTESDELDKRASDTEGIINMSSGRASFPVSSNQLKTLHYKANQIHDFAWFADKRFHVLKGKVKLPESGREITTWVMFTNEQADLWKDALQYVTDAILFYSTHIGDYPYESYTVVQSALSAGLGMEYPGISVIGMVESAYSLDEVITHEIGHNWFYGALGFNERQYPYLDEGLTSAYTTRYMNEKYPDKKLWEVYVGKEKMAKFLHIDQMPIQRMQELGRLNRARNNLEQPINLPATDYSDMNYGVMIYNKADMAFNYLRAYLGDSVFDASIQEYYRKLIFTHPHPNDLRTVFETNTNKDLNWFFDDLIGTTKRMDYKIVKLENQQLLVKNLGELASPIVISGITKDSIFFEKWVDGFEGQKWIEIPPGNYTEVKIDHERSTPEIYRLNNNIKKTGIFPKSDPVRPQIFFSVEDPEKRSLMYIPAANWTRENGFMIGVAVHNGFILPKRFEYLVMPFYAFGNNDLAGFGRMAFNITPFEKFIRKATISLEGTQYGAPGNQNYQKIKTGLDLYFRNKKMNSQLTQKVSGNYIAATSLYQIELGQKAEMNSFLQFGYRLEQHRLINPFSVQANLETGHSYQKTSVELNYKVSYYGQNQGLDIRLFAGTMLKNDSNIPFYAFAAGGRNGREQYLYQGSYPDRFAVFPDNFLSRQMTLSEGNLVSAVNDSLGYSRWLVSLSFTTTLPKINKWVPVKPFVNLLLNDHGFGNGNNSPLFFEAGIKAGFWDLFEIYIPLVVSKNIDSVSGPFKNRIRFILSLDLFSKEKLISK